MDSNGRGHLRSGELKGLNFALAYSHNNGELLGNNNGVQFTIA